MGPISTNYHYTTARRAAQKGWHRHCPKEGSIQNGRAEKERGRIRAKLTRLKYLYLDEGDLTKSEYRQRKAGLQARLDALQVPEQNAIIQAGEYLDTLGELRDKGTVKQRHRLLQGMVHKVRVDLSRERVVCIEPHAEFVALFREIKDLEEKQDGCFWWKEEETITAC